MEKEQNPAAGQSGPVVELSAAPCLAALNYESMAAGQRHGLVTAAAIDKDDLTLYAAPAHQRSEFEPFADLGLFIEGRDDDRDI
jgi:hypothetical protein